MKKVFFAVAVLFLVSCEKETRHVFHYTITGNYKKAMNLYGEMGPGIKFDSPVIDIPFDVVHEVYGNNLAYALRVEDTDTTHKYTLKVFIDDVLIKESSTYEKIGADNPRISVSGIFVQ
ncbi:MAG: hypothetical protein NT150_01265 [Bacteroidetes bacterium]|nr:hypothetical protein [Bacteroidota bacterium]